MRKSAKALILAIVALIGSLGLTIAAAFSASLAFGATALIVPGTGTHNVLTNKPYRDNAADRYINPAGVPCTSTDGCDIQGVDYPATFFPLVIFSGWCPNLSCDTWNVSVNTGVENLDTALEPFKQPGNTEDVIVFGYSQGGAVVSREMYNLANLSDEEKARISVVTIGNINNPRGLFSRLSFLPTIPFLDISFGPQLPTDIGIKSTNYSFEYDPVGDAPSYWGNPFAMLNAIAAFEYVHGYYLVPNDNGPTEVLPYGYTYGPDGGTLQDAIDDPANSRTYQDATFVLIPQQGPLPLYQPFIDLGKQFGISSIVNPLVALVNPVTKLLVDLGYDRVTNPGIPQTLSILPFNPFTFNPITFTVQFVEAIVKGVEDALNGGASMLAPTTSNQSSDANVQAIGAFSRLANTDGDDAQVVQQVSEHDDGATGEGAGDGQGGAAPLAAGTTDPDAEKAAAEAAAAEAAAAEAAAKEAAAKEAAAKEAAEKEAAAKEAAEAAAADAAAKEAAAKEAAAKEAAEKEAAAKEAEEAAAKQAEKDAKAAKQEAKEAEQQEAADKAKEAADKVKAAAAENAKAANQNGDNEQDAEKVAEEKTEAKDAA